MIVLGPVPCQGCRQPVIYAIGAPPQWLGHGALRWLDADTTNPHRCPARAREAWDNEPVGISDASPDIMCDALLVADTSREGVPRLEVSAP